MKRLLVVGALAMIALSACQKEQQSWVIFGKPNNKNYDESYSYQPSSIQKVQTKSGDTVKVMSISIMDNKTKEIRYRRWHVMENDCTVGYGKVFATEVDGSTWVNTYDFASKSGSVVSDGADTLCDNN